MNLDLDRFFRACYPSKTLNMGNSEDRKYYIDFATVRGDKVIDKLKRTITRLSPHQPTCQLFTGHIGCGKSTELSRLEVELKDAGFHVVYFQVTEDLDVADVDITDILLAIAHQVSESLQKSKIGLQPQGFKALLKNIANVLPEMSAEAKIPGIGTAKINQEGVEFSLPDEIAKITVKAKNSQQVRSKLRQHLEPQTNQILRLINQEIIDIATEQLKASGKKGLVVIVDNLDRVQNQTTAASSKPLSEYIFVERGEQLRQINCHLVYTLPLSLIFSNAREELKSRLGNGTSPIVLPMVPVQLRDGTDHPEGMALLQQMVLARAFPNAKPKERMDLVTDIFENLDTLNRLCRINGGHVRHLMGMLYGCIQEEDPPISRRVLENVIRKERDSLIAAIDEEEWELLFQVVKDQRVKGDREYQTLLQTLFVFEYHDERGTWFNLNPLLFETDKYKLWKQQDV